MSSSYRLLKFHQRDQWRSILRSLLRECSYLPDPIARAVCHHQVIQRFRRYQEEPTDHLPDQHDRLFKLHRNARAQLSVLRRANEGYTKPLMNVLQIAYGRRGKRRRDLIRRLLAGDAPSNSDDLESILLAPRQFHDAWCPPVIVTELLRSQKSNPYVVQLLDHAKIKKLAPDIPEKNSWGRQVPLKRRINIRREWYNRALGTLVPPLPAMDLEILEGLISGALPWKAPKRRSKQHVVPLEDSDNEAPRAGMIRKVLTDGPPKQETFEAYLSGRPHNITRRFMSRLWQRISCIVPRQTLEGTNFKPRFTWDKVKAQPAVTVSVREESSQDIFGGFDGQDETSPERTVKVQARTS
ncbi:hypothetical protein BJX99DRAFT_239791 [Aspergillus californicus]